MQQRWSARLPAGDFLSWPDVSADGRTLVVSIIGGSGQDQQVIRYDVWDSAPKPGSPAFQPPGPGRRWCCPTAAAFSRPPTTAPMRCCRCPADGVRRSFRAEFSGPGSQRLDLQPMAVTPDGDVLVEGADPGPSPITTPGRDGKHIGSTTGDQSPTNDRLGLIDPVSGRLLDQASLGAIYDISSVGWSRDGTR